MTEREILEFLFELGKTSRDPEGVVAACLVRQGQILAASASSDDGRYHAEYLVVRQARERGVTVDDTCVLYTTLAPCSDMPAVNDGRDCTTCLLEAGIRHVVFAADDLEYGTAAASRLRGAGATYRQVDDRELVRRAAELFDSTLTRPLGSLHLPRARRLDLGST